jgi:hypothetical protein
MAAIDDRVDAIEVDVQTALDAIDELQDNISTLSNTVKEQSSITIKPDPGTSKVVLTFPEEPIAIKDSKKKNINVKLLLVRFKVPTPAGLVEYTAQEVADDKGTLAQDLYDAHPDLFKVVG